MKSLRIVALSLSLAACSGGNDDSAPKANLPEMIDIPAGTFTMGAPAADDAQQGKPQHEVTLAAFRLAQTPVTFDQYDAFASAVGRPLPQDDGLGRGDRPVVNIDRGDMLAYIDWLNRQGAEGHYRFPSEAEWEYAARAGTTTTYYWGDDPSPDQANIRGTGGRDTYEFTAPVKAFPANPWGLYAMAGNVWEMTSDCLTPGYQNAPDDGSPNLKGQCFAHMTRGGDYSSSKRGQKPTARAAAGDHFSSTSLGFRVAQDAPQR